MHTKLNRVNLVFFVLTIASMVFSSQSIAMEAWVKIYDPPAQLQQNLPAEAIDYGSFIWAPAAVASDLIQAQHIDRIENPFALTVGSLKIDPRAGFPETESGWNQSPAHAEADFRLVQFNGPIKGEWLDELRTAGLEPVQYLHPFSYIVWAEANKLSTADSLTNVRWAGEFVPAFRVPLQSRESTDSHVYAMAMIYAPAQTAIISNLRQNGVTVITNRSLNRHFNIVQLETSPDSYLALAQLPGVFTLQQIGQDAGPRGEMSNQSVVGGYDDTNTIFTGYLSWLNPTGLDGSGVVVGIVDGGVRGTHQDLTDNMVSCLGVNGSCTSANDNHGTHVAGAVGGTGISGVTDSNGFLRGQGVAPAASLIEQRYPPFLGGGPGGMAVNGMLDIYQDSAVSGAVLTNNSWGPTGTPQGYDIPTMEIDFITRDADPDTAGSQPVLPVWSIMNGNGDRNVGICAPSSLGSPDEAKNLFAVGSTVLQVGGGNQSSDIFSVSANSAHGQACDGRQVPHIVAPGCSTDSTTANSDSSYSATFCGTSMASPIVSGSVSLFSEQYRNEFGIDPSPALIKARFTAVTMDLIGNTDADGNTLGHRPDRKQGWGRLNLDAVINPPQSVIFIDQTEIFSNTGDDWQETYTAADPDEPIRIMLAWSDAPGPGTGGLTPAWVNDLDLILTIDDQTYFGNNISTADGFSQAGGSADTMNNLEGIMLSAAQHQGGSINLQVLASNVTADAIDPWIPAGPRQDFAIVCYNCAPGIEVFKSGFESQ